MNIVPSENNLNEESFFSGDNSFYEPLDKDPLGLISEEDSEILKQKFTKITYKRFQKFLSTRQINRAQELALDLNFKSNNSQFCSSGDLPFLALINDEIELFNELINGGYVLPPNFIIRLVNKGDPEKVRFLIENEHYSNLSSELAFWMCLKNSYLESAQLLLEKEEIIRDLFSGYDMISRHTIDLFLTSLDVVNKVIKSALDVREDLLACDLLVRSPVVIDTDIIKRAVSNNCLETLKVIWTGNVIPPTQVAYKRSNKSVIWQKLGIDVSDKTERKKINRMLRIPSIINNLLNSNLVDEVVKVLDWPEACNESGILFILTNQEKPDLIIKYLDRTKIEVSGEEFLAAFNKEYYRACLKMLRFKDPRAALCKKEVQQKLIELMEYGDTCLDAIQILNYISYRDWCSDLIINLCTTLDELISLSDEISCCQNPILFCVLVAEFLHQISQKTAQNKHRCIECADSYIKQVIHLEESIKELEVLQFLVTEQDSKGRSALLIMSENDFLVMLEDLKIGSIVSSMWKGNDGEHIWNASRIFKGIASDSQFLGPLDDAVPYTFSFDIWITASSIRSVVGTVSILFLLAVYTALIIEGSKYSVTDVCDCTDDEECQIINFLIIDTMPGLHSLLRMSQILILGLMCDLCAQYLFCSLSNRNFYLDAMRITDIINFCMMMLILAGLQDNMGCGRKYPDADPALFVGLIHSLEYFFIWVRFLLILITTKRLGPFLFMIYNIMKKMISFYFLFACFSIWFAAVFTALFSQGIPASYGSFWLSMRTLYCNSLGGLTFNDFQGVNKSLLGILLLGLYLIITNIMLLNLFIALFTAIYEQIWDQVESTYRSVVIFNYEKWRWDKKCGSLTLYSSPFSVIGFFLYPFLSLSRDPEPLDRAASKVIYAAIYGVLEMTVLVLIDLLLLPVAYLLGFFKYPKKMFSSRVDIENSEPVYQWKRAGVWLFIGIPLLLFSIIQDIIYFWRVLFIEHTEKKTSHPFITDLNITALKESFKYILGNYITAEDLSKLLVYVKRLMTCERENPEDLPNALDFLTFFLQSSSDRRINLTVMKNLVERIDDIRKLAFIRIYSINKGISTYRDLIGGVEIEGQVLPKKLGRSGGLADIKNMNSTFKLMLQMEEQVDCFSKIIKGIKERHS